MNYKHLGNEGTGNLYFLTQAKYEIYDSFASAEILQNSVNIYDMWCFVCEHAHTHSCLRKLTY